MKISRSISPLALLLTAVGGVVGSGWLFCPLYAARIAGPAAILSWILGGSLMMLIGLTFAEIASSFPVTGGMVRFARMTHDSLVSFTISWMAWLSSVVVAPIETAALLQYASNYWPALVQQRGGVEVLTQLGMLLAAIVMLVMCVLNRMGVIFFSRANSLITTLKLAIPIITLSTFFLVKFHPVNFTAGDGFAPQGLKGILSSLPTAGIIFSFIGYNAAIQMAGEAKNPQRAIPFAIIGSLLFCMMLYVLLQIAFLGALDPTQTAGGWAKLSFSGVNGPFAGLSNSFGLIWLVMMIYVGAFVSPFGTAFIYTASTARMNYAMSQNGYFPPFMQNLNKKGVPMAAIMSNYVVGLILLLPFPGWQSMVGFLVSCIVIAYIIGPIALLALRTAQPNHKRPFRLPCAKVLSVLAFYVCNLIVFWTGWQTLSYVILAILIGYVFLFAYRHFTPDHKLVIDWRRSWWLLPYIGGVATISYLGSYGNGINVIKFGWDFVVIAIFSFFIFIAAVKSAKKEMDIEHYLDEPTVVEEPIINDGLRAAS